MTHQGDGRLNIRRPLKLLRMNWEKPSTSIPWPKGRPHHTSGWSVKGLSAVLLQKGRPVIHVSRILMPAETGYSNIEQKLLSIVFDLKRIHQCVLCSNIKVQTDHTNTHMEEISAVSPQLQHLLYRLAKYDIKLKYLRGEDGVITDAWC